MLEVLTHVLKTDNTVFSVETTSVIIVYFAGINFTSRALFIRDGSNWAIDWGCTYML